jgi:hypothetical protein
MEESCPVAGSPAPKGQGKRFQRASAPGNEGPSPFRALKGRKKREIPLTPSEQGGGLCFPGVAPWAFFRRPAGAENAPPFRAFPDLNVKTHEG